MKVLVTGISGYIASVLAPRLLQDEEVAEVRGIDLQPPKNIDTASPKLVFLKKDIRDPDIADAFSGIDVLFHLAFVVSPNVPYKQMDSINIDGSKNVFNAAAKAGISRILYTSSIAAYGADPTHKLPLKEDSPLKPNADWYYSRAKGAVESFLNEFEPRHPNIKVTRFRPAILLGPKINNFFGTLLKAPLITDLDKDAKVEWVWDEDVIQAIYLAFKKEKTGIYNVGGGNALTWKEIARAAGKRTIRAPYTLTIKGAELLGKLGILNRGWAEWVGVALKYTLWMDSSRARLELGWEPKYDSAGAIRAFLKK